MAISMQMRQAQAAVHQGALRPTQAYHVALPHVLRSRRHATCVCQWGSDKRGGLLPDGVKLPSLPNLPNLPSAPKVSGSFLDLSSAPTQSAVFGLLSVTSGLLAIGALAAPELLLNTLLPATGAGGAGFAGLDPTLLRVAGATLLISAAAEYCLQDAAANNRLSSATYQRLMVACVFKSMGYLLAFALAEPVWNPMLAATYPTAAALSVIVNLSVLLATNKDVYGKQTVPNLLPALAPTNAASWVYSGCVLLYLATAAACYAPPDAPSLFVGELGWPSSMLLQHTWAPGFLLAAVASLNLKVRCVARTETRPGGCPRAPHAGLPCCTLEFALSQDAADRGRLGASTFKRLNLGLAGLELVYSAIFISALTTRTAAGDAAGISNLIASLGIAGFCLNQWLYASKNK